MNAPIVTCGLGERDLLLFIRRQVLRHLTIVETDVGRFVLRVKLTVEPRNFVLVNSRGKPRDWSSLNALANHIRTKFGVRDRIGLALVGSVQSDEFRPAGAVLLTDENGHWNA